LKLIMATTGVIALCVLVAHTPLPWNLGERWAAAVRLVEVTVTCMLLAWPVATLTNFLTASERKMVWEVVLRRQKSALGES
jgi:hypothetical protein